MNVQTRGELVHFDIKKLGRIDGIGHRITGDRTDRSDAGKIGWEYAHVCIDDASRSAYIEVLPDETGLTASGFAQHALAWYHDQGVRVERVMTDNGSAYRSRTFAGVLNHLGGRQIYTRPYSPKANGKAERFIQTVMREWAYERPYSTSAARNAMLPRWLHRYNYHRPHSALRGNGPMTRIPAVSRTFWGATPSSLKLGHRRRSLSSASALRDGGALPASGKSTGKRKREPAP
jgi:hypothetical protein